jgi:hypothetical protein
LKKIEKLKITGTALDWFKSHLANRKQTVGIAGNYQKAGYLISPSYKELFLPQYFSSVT